MIFNIIQFQRWHGAHTVVCFASRLNPCSDLPGGPIKPVLPDSLQSGHEFQLVRAVLKSQNQIGSMYGIYANIWGILMVNFIIYSIHGSYENIVQKKLVEMEITYKLMITQNSTVGAEPANVYLQQGRICCVHLKLDHILPT